MMRYGYGMMGGSFMIIPLILIGLIIFAAVKFSQGGRNNYGGHRGGGNALDILDERFAKGEITEDEYNRKKKMLRD